MVAAARGGVGRRRHSRQQRRHPARQDLRQDGARRFRDWSCRCICSARRSAPRRSGTACASAITGGSCSPPRPRASTAISARPITARPRRRMIGLMNVLHLEGAKYDIRVNTLLPTAATGMTEGLLPAETAALLGPEIGDARRAVPGRRGRALARDHGRRRRRLRGDPYRRRRRASSCPRPSARPRRSPRAFAEISDRRDRAPARQRLRPDLQIRSTAAAKGARRQAFARGAS